MDKTNLQPTSTSVYSKLWNLRSYFSATPIFITGLILWLSLIPASFISSGYVSLPFYDMKGELDANEIFLMFIFSTILIGLYTPLLPRRNKLIGILWSLYTVFYHFALTWPTLAHRISHSQLTNSLEFEFILSSVILNCCISLILFWALYVGVKLFVKFYLGKLLPEAICATAPSTTFLSSRKHYLPLLLNLLFLLPPAATLTIVLIRNAEPESHISYTIPDILGYACLASFILIFPICTGIYCFKNQAKAYLHMKVAPYAFLASGSIMLLIGVLLFGEFTYFETGDLYGYLLCGAVAIPLSTLFASYRVGKIQVLSTTPTLFPKSTKTILPSCITLSGFAAYILLAPWLMFVSYERFHGLLIDISANSLVGVWLIAMSFSFANIYAAWCMFKAPKPFRAMLCSFLIIPISIVGTFLYRSLGETAITLFVAMTLIFLVSIWIFFGFYSLGKRKAKRKLKKESLATS